MLWFPDFFIQIDELPLLANGKVNTKALPPPENINQNCSSSTNVKKTEMEELVADAWSQALSIPTVEIEDNFFDIGGHSLLATQVINLISTKLKRIRSN